MSVRRSSLLLLLFLSLVVSLPAQTRRAEATNERRKAVATVNGQPIPWSHYEQELENNRRVRDDGDAAGVDAITADTILIDLVEKELIRQEAAKRRIVVTRQNAIESLVKNPPEFIRPPFTDAEGTFHRDLFERVVRKPEQIVGMLRSQQDKDSLVGQWRRDLDEVIRFVQNAETRRRLLDILDRENPVTAAEIRNRYFAERAKIVGSFVRVLHSTVADSLAPISDAEARAWYAAHRDEYYAAPARMLGTVVIPVDPLPSDSARQRARIDSVRRILQDTPPDQRLATVRAIQRSLPADRFPENEIVRPSQLTPEMLRQLAPSEVGDVVGPFVRDNESIYLFVERRAPAGDTAIHARHIVMRGTTGDQLGDTSAVELITLLRDSIDNEAEFREAARYFSTDASSAQEGDLGWFTRGRMIPAFDSVAFSAPLGTVVGPFRTEFGHHLVWVSERLTDGFVLRELRFPIVASDSARALVRRDAEIYRRVLLGEMPRDSVYRVFARRYHGMASDTSYVRRLDRYGDVLDAAAFAFSARVGDVAIIELPLNRIMVTKVQSIWNGGTPEFEKIPQFPTSHARRRKQLDLLEPRMKAIADSITPDMLIGPLRELAPMAEVFLISDRSVTAPPDEDALLLDSLIAAVPANSVGGPVRGVHGFYFLRVLEKQAPGAADFLRDADSFTAAYRARKREQVLRELVNDARMRAEFVDLR